MQDKPPYQCKINVAKRPRGVHSCWNGTWSAMQGVVIPAASADRSGACTPFRGRRDILPAIRPTLVCNSCRTEPNTIPEPDSTRLDSESKRTPQLELFLAMQSESSKENRNMIGIQTASAESGCDCGYRRRLNIMEIEKGDSSFGKAYPSWTPLRIGIVKV